MNFLEKYGPTALVAGASEGLGEAFARALAARGLDLVLVARRKEPLERVSEDIVRKFSVQVRPLVCDLSLENATEVITSALGSRQVNCLVYNAASSDIGAFENIHEDDHLQTLSVNTRTPLKMMHRFGKNMLRDGRGCMILMSSLAGMQGSGYLATYAATKAFIRVMGESLWYEWKEKGIDVITCCAGATMTPGYVSSHPRPLGYLAPKPQRPEAVVHECLARIGRSPLLIPGRGNKIASFFMQHVLGRKGAITIMGDTTRKIYGIND